MRIANMLLAGVALGVGFLAGHRPLMGASAGPGPSKGGVCAPGDVFNASNRHLFAGAYTLVPLSVTMAGDTGDMHGVLGGLSSFVIPDLGPGTFFDQAATNQNIVSYWTSETDSASTAALCYSSAIMRYQGPTWCTASTTRRDFVIRFSTAHDMRIKNGGYIPSPIGQCHRFCPLWNHGSCDKNFGAGVITYLLPGNGFPIAAFESQEPARARRDANALYLNGNVQQGGMPFSAYSLLLSGQIKKKIDTVNVSGQPMERRQIFRTLEGYVGRRTYADPRVGVVPDSASGGLFEVHAVFQGSPIISQVPLGQAPESGYAALDAVGAAFCGGSSWTTCGSVSTGPTGMTEVPGGDDSLRAVQVCRLAANQSGNTAALGACTTSASPFDVNPTLSGGKGQQSGVNVGAASGTALGGNRPGGSRRERYCRAVAKRDSLGAFQQGSVWSEQQVRALVQACLSN